MRVLHLFSNYKLTGPADPAMILIRSLRQEGIDASLACGRPPEGSPGLVPVARQRGIPTCESLALTKHGRPIPLLADVRRLRRLLAEESFDILHCHLPNDHLIAALAARRRGVPVMRSLYDTKPPGGWRARVALGGSAALLPSSPRVAGGVEKRFPDFKGVVEAIDPGLDLERFQCPRDGSRRRSWGATKDDLVLGVVARMQTHRLFPELIEGFASVAREDPGLHLVILGRGTNRARVAHQPARASGVGERIHFPGHLSGEEYPRSLACFDALIFLVPGSDGTCRAAREALASGVPVIASRRGQLPELIHDRENGLLLEMETPGAIAQAIRRLRSLPEMRSRLAATAREVARARFDPRRQARRVIDVYRRVLEPGGNR